MQEVHKRELEHLQKQAVDAKEKAFQSTWDEREARESLEQLKTKVLDLKGSVKEKEDELARRKEQLRHCENEHDFEGEENESLSK